jgi:hypothetical protein
VQEYFTKQNFSETHEDEREQRQKIHQNFIAVFAVEKYSEPVRAKTPSSLVKYSYANPEYIRSHCHNSSLRAIISR